MGSVVFVEDVIQPGATLGVLGGGQLGRMFAHAAQAMGYGVHVFCPDEDAPAVQVAQGATIAAYTDHEALLNFARGVDVVTLEFENIPLASVKLLETVVPVRPGSKALAVAQQRITEKTTLKSLGVPVTPFMPVNSQPDLEEAVRTLETPGVLKTAGFGYDGKGQAKITEESDLGQVWSSYEGQAALYEAWVPFQLEASVIAARSVDGTTRFYPLFENHHANHVLSVTLAPTQAHRILRKNAYDIATTILEGLNYVGILCVEMFVQPNGDLLVNEIAPRPHNSGHITMDASYTSQFEQQVRAICGLPLGQTDFHHHGAMVNLMGDLWDRQDPPDWAKILTGFEGAKLHLYGKGEARPGRKMGHVNLMAGEYDQAKAKAQQLQAALKSQAIANLSTVRGL